MANRSYLYSLDVFPNYMKPRAIGLSESEYSIPLIYRILVSSSPQATESILFSGQEKIAITADYDGGVRKLEEFFSKLPEEYKEKADNVIKFLKDYKNRQLYIHLECAEIFEMEIEDEDELEKKNAELVEEIKNIDEEIKKALKRIHYDGDTFDVRELEAKYWSNTLYFTPGSDNNASEDEEPNAKLEPEQAHNEAKADDIESYLAEPEHHQYSYGGVFFALIIKEGEEVALPLEPERMFEEGDYRLFILDSDNEKLGEIEYHRAIELIRKNAYFETIDKVDGFDCLFFQYPPKKDFLLQLLQEAQSESTTNENKAPQEESATQNPRITRTLVHGVRPAYFETVHVEGDENNPAGIEMARTVLTRAQSDAAMDFVFSESTQIDTDEDDEVFPIDSFSFYWAIQYCNALSITCALEPCYSIDGETNPRKWLYAPYSEFNSYTKQTNSDYENSDYYARLVFNPNANGWRLPTLDECKRAAKTDGIQKDTIAELGFLWVWREDIPSHSALVSSDWNKEDLTALFNSPEVATPQYSIRICRNAGTVLPETVYYDWRKAKEEAEEYEEEESDFDKAERERLVEEFWQAHKERQRQEQAEKEEQTSWFHILAPIVIIILGLFFFTITNRITVFYAVAVLLYLTHDKKQPRADSQKPRADSKKPLSDSKKRQQTVSYEAQTETSEEETPDYAGWWNYKPNGLNDFQQAEQPEADSQDKKASGKYTHEQAKWILQRIHDTDGAESIRIKTAVKDSPLPLTASKFGGLPYWERTDEFPRDEDGKPLYLLAQINFADVPHLPDFPEKGLLQIFVQADDTWGLDFKDEKQKNWRIVYHKFFSSSLAMSEADLRAMGVKTASDEKDEDEYLPFEKEYALSFEKQLTFVHPNCDDQFDYTVQTIAEELGFPVFDGGALDWFEEDDFNAFYLENKEAQHQIGGFPNFTQSDVRRVGDVLLFQMDSELGKGENGKGDDWEILWGDCGIANFFISREDLRNRDFSNVLYNWDCY